MKKWIDANEIKMIHELDDKKLRKLDIEMRKIPKFHNEDSSGTKIKNNK